MKRVLSFVLLLVCVCACLLNGNLPAKVYALEEFQVDAKSAILMDWASGEVLAEVNADDKLEIASMVKLMTIYLTTLEIGAGRLTEDEKVLVSEHAASMGGSQIFLDAGESYSVGKLLEGVIMASANDASVVLAERISGSEKEFVALMNKTAVSLGMNDTQYQNATGLAAPMQFSTARDVSRMLGVLVGNEIYHKYATKWMDSLVHPSGRKTEVVNTNKLTRYFKGCDSGKTGFTDEAGYCLAASAKRDEMRLVSVVMGAKSASTRFSESVKLLNWGFSNFKSEIVVDEKQSVGEILVKKSLTEKVSVYPSESFSALTRLGKTHEFETVVELDKSISAPAKCGESVGKLSVCKNGAVVKEIALVVKEDIDAIKYFEAVRKVAENW